MWLKWQCVTAGKGFAATVMLGWWFSAPDSSAARHMAAMQRSQCARRSGEMRGSAAVSSAGPAGRSSQ
jgi:hypothetical protein